MLHTPAWSWTWTAARAAIAVLIAAAIIAQAVATVSGALSGGRDVGTTIANFFSFFTILSNVLTVVVMLWAVGWFVRRGSGSASSEPRALGIALACVTTYMVITGIVYNTLLRGIQLPQGTTVPWENEVLHVVGPLFLLVDLFVAPRPRCLGWGAILAVLGFPLAWVVYTMVRGPLVTNPTTGAAYWYPYPFLDPGPHGYGYVAVMSLCVAVAAAAFVAVVAGATRLPGRVIRPRG